MAGNGIMGADGGETLGLHGTSSDGLLNIHSSTYQQFGNVSE